MHPDDAAQPPATKRPAIAHDRPTRPPLGPRRPKHPPDTPPHDSPSPEPALLALPAHTDAAVQTPSSPPPMSSPTAIPPKPAPATFVAPPPLAPPPAVSFESTPIPWKGLPLEAAQWTFSSSELQEIVSRAIRLSARESFVRLLSLQALEVDIVHESQRLETERLTAQAKWRFEVGRRTMLMQALNASAANEHPDSASPVLGFVAQLASAVASCDSLLSTILHISDQQSQIALVQHQHWASALGMALRKLNKAHERQAQELQSVRARVQTLEDELEEAWCEAEKMAIEFNDLEQEIAESEASEVVDSPEDVADPRPNPQVKHDPDETGTLGDMTIHTDIAVVLGVTATAVASKATLVPSSTGPVLPDPTSVDKSDTKSIRSFKSTRSRRSTRDGPNHLARLSSARSRSRAVSNASLRLPKALRSMPPGQTSPMDTPPMPPLPPNAVSGNSFLDMDNIPHEHVRKIPPRRQPEPTLALPSPPYSAGLPATRVPSIWLESDGSKPTRLNGLDRSHSLQIFSSLSPGKMRRSNLVMSLTGSDRSSDGGVGSCSASSLENQVVGAGPGTRTASPSSNHSPVSLPTHALAHFRGPSLSSSSAEASTGSGLARPGSAGARLTTTWEEKTKTLSVRSPSRSLVSRASSVILRRLSQATISGRGPGGSSLAATTGSSGGKGITLGSPSKQREASLRGGSGRSLVERWKDRGRDGAGIVPDNVDEEGETGEEGEVMLIGSPDSFDVS